VSRELGKEILLIMRLRMRLFHNGCWKGLIHALFVEERFLSIGSINARLYKMAGKVSILVIENTRKRDPSFVWIS
jgi:hypothetical protein